MRLSFARLAISGLVVGFILPAGAALAIDAKQVADSVVSSVTATGKSTAKYADASASGDTVTISGYEMTNQDGETITIPSLVLSGVAPRDQGGFTATGIALDGGSMTVKGEVMTWKTGMVADAVIPTTDEIKAKAHIKPFSKVNVAGINVTGSDIAAPIDISSVDMTLDAADDGTPRDFDLEVQGIAVPAAVFDDHPQQKALIDALGYTDFLVNVSVAGGYDAASDTMTLRGLTIDAANVGKLAIAAKVTGVSLGKLVSGESTADAKSTAKLESLSIRFDNAGIVEKALDMQATMIGGSRSDVVDQLSGALPFMLNIIGNEGFQNKIAGAATTFLKEPKSIAVAAAPAAPVGFDTILSTAIEAPETLPDVLAVDVTADQ
jgi:hypothetical protein